MARPDHDTHRTSARAPTQPGAGTRHTPPRTATSPRQPLVREKGAAPWQPQAPAALTAATHGALGPLQSTLLLAGQPEQLGADALALIGLKPRQLSTGKDMLGTLAPADLAALVGALLPEDAADLWTTGPDTGRGPFGDALAPTTARGTMAARRAAVVRRSASSIRRAPPG
ncbi:hypothetical protein [Streptomyces sp. DHE17-7]|uniref:hypothetical protein n=1 Tax=Streptomyces sp. DHE17-7 TaxID=2759949 RepID=UPI0022EAE9D5|nr:hypothetical protein [Streptomyces sp. DHE17-7]MBJ6618468.1 hypothetical protein [Streptomyces sp. DHE17-7]